jgi:hypothetical protein
LIYQQHWITLTEQTRQKLRELFKIPQSSHTEVVNNQVVSDGITNKDLEVLTDEAMALFLGEPVQPSEIMFKKIIDIISMPPVTPEIAPIIKDEVKDDNKCDKCEFVGKNERSLRFHKIKKNH